MQIIHTVLQSTVGHSPHMQTGQKKNLSWPFNVTTSNTNITINVLQGFVAFRIYLLLKKLMYPHTMERYSS